MLSDCINVSAEEECTRPLSCPDGPDYLAGDGEIIELLVQRLGTNGPSYTLTVNFLQGSGKSMQAPQKEASELQPYSALSFDAICPEGDVIDRAWTLYGKLTRADGSEIMLIDFNIPKYTSESAMAMVISSLINNQCGDESLTSVQEFKQKPNRIQLHDCKVELAARPIDEFQSGGALAIIHHSECASHRTLFGPGLASEVSFNINHPLQRAEQTWDLELEVHTAWGQVHKVYMGIPDGTTLDAIVALLTHVINRQDGKQYAEVRKVDNRSDLMILSDCAVKIEIAPESDELTSPELTVHVQPATMR